MSLQVMIIVCDLKSLEKYLRRGKGLIIYNEKITFMSKIVK